MRLSIAGGLALALVGLGVAMAPPATAAHHEAVIQVVSVEVKPGMLEKYRGEVKKLIGILSRLESPAKLRMWNTSVGGPDAGTVIVGLEYPNAAAWAADAPKMQSDAEWQKVLGGLGALRTLEGNSVWRDISVTPVASKAPGSGSVLAITAVQVKPGMLDEYRKRVDGARAILERLDLGGTMRMWHAEVAGPNTGSVVVGVEYDDLAAYVADQGKLAMDAEWKRLISGLDEIRTLTGRWLYQEITP